MISLGSISQPGDRSVSINYILFYIFVDLFNIYGFTYFRWNQFSWIVRNEIFVDFLLPSSWYWL